jgi:hypothetical protein
MKKAILLTFFVLTAFLANAQMTLTPTSITFTGNTPPSGTQTGYFYSYQPNNNGGTFYLDNTCTTVGTQSAGGDVGGFDPNVYDATPGRTAGVIFYGGGIRQVYWGIPCSRNYPSFGFHTGSATGGYASAVSVDLSNPANQKISFKYQSDLAITLYLQLLDENYTEKLTNSTAAINLLGDGLQHSISLDFSSAVALGADLTNVKQVSFTYPSDTKSGDFGISISNIKVGSAVTAVSEASANIASAKLYPNPVSDQAKVELELRSVADVKVTLSDIMGKELMTVAQGTMSSLNTEINVTNLNKGIYTVNYFINGAAAKSELLMVK